MKQVCLVVTLCETGFQVVRIPTGEEGFVIPPVTVEMQIKNPKLGLITASSATSDLVRALNEAVREVNPDVEQDVFVLAGE